MKCNIILLLLLLPVFAVAQEKFVFEGKISFERKINVHPQVDAEDESAWYKEFVLKSPVFHTTGFVLQFTKDQTIYKPETEVPKSDVSWLIGPAKENVIYKDLSKQQMTGLKAVFERSYVVADSLRQSAWRITDEKRTIAGMECRKAITIICDSVYVVAFYAEEIPVSGGPESFSGLPGMILGLAIPRLHTTWFATKISLAVPAASDFALKPKGQKTDNRKLFGQLKSSLENWGKYGERNIWWALL